MILKQGAHCPRKTFKEEKLCKNWEELEDTGKQDTKIYPVKSSLTSGLRNILSLLSNK